MFPTELITTPPHLHLFLLLSSSLSVIGMARCSSHHHLWVLPFFPHIPSIISLRYSPWKNSHTRLSALFLPTATTLVLVTITFHREWSNSPLIVLLEPSLFPCPQGTYLQNKYMNEKHPTSLKTQAVVYLTGAKKVNL